jgi:hypothetical protein
MSSAKAAETPKAATKAATKEIRLIMDKILKS